ncbi:AfsR/SARP family transcriptional regulator [Streptomyces hainanensis]|uniref:OmpR/PhoB-type domain-containing protein n=1 Tax=Streptomyces hainanensis TaxID=402648 RepID=A0A4R4TA20_9ACTN|nr:BTAD domain-containing putative transcriptional regulator [Streptomyces hainanensis]TDC73977.1 hypothetical protein E1283_17380 [Streptomyces hainanensis]
MQFSLLGPVRAWSDEIPVPLGPPQRRAVLALLLLASAQSVTTAALRERLWDKTAPSTAISAIQVHIHHLRKALASGGGSHIDTYPGFTKDDVSYALAVDPGALDTTRFESLLDASEAARNAGAPASAVERLDEALGLWRGHPAPELQSTPYVITMRRRLTDLRVDAVRRRASCLLDLGAVTRATADLLELNTEHPGNEKTVVLLSNALCRGGAHPRALRLLSTELDRWQHEYGLRPAELVRERERLANGGAMP